MIEEALLKSNFNGKDGFVWWIGQVAKKTSWDKGSQFCNKGDWAARCKVRIIGYHSFDGNILADDDLPWAQVMLDPSFGSGHGGIGGTIDLKGGETCFGFFLDGDDAQQPVVVGLLYRSDGVKNLQTEDVINKEKSSQFKPFTGHPGNIVPDTQRDSRASKPIDPTGTTADRNKVETPPLTPDQIKQSYNYSQSKGIVDSLGNKVYFQPGDKIAGVFKNNPAFSTNAVLGAFTQRPAYVTPNGCQNNLISQITQGIQDFIAFTNGLDKYLGVYINPVLNEVVDIANSVKQCANQIVGIVKLIINTLRDTIFKCLGWLFRQIVAIKVPIPQQKKIIEAFKKILDKIFCVIEKLNFFPFIQNLLGDLASNTINSPVCAVEQFTAGILAKVMDGIDTALADIMSGINWLTDGIGTISGILNQASSLASQIFSFLECTGLACKTPHVWAANFGPSQKEADDWQKMVNNVNVFKGISDGLGSIEDAMYQTPLFAGIDGLFNNVYNQCNQKVQNPTSQNDIIPLPIGSKYTTCLPPIARIVGDGIGASAVPIVSSDSSIFSVEIINGGVGYTYASIVIADNTGCGNGATANAVIENGVITSIYVINPGSGYVSGNYTNIGTETITPTGRTETGGTGGTGTTINPGISSQVSGCIQSIILVKPGYGYTVGDTITDGQNTYVPNVSPKSGAIVSIQPLTNPVCGFATPPTLTINTNTGVGAQVLPFMKYYPTYVSVNQNLVNNQIPKTGITTVIDCI